jgi:hypothetical protein
VTTAARHRLSYAGSCFGTILVQMPEDHLFQEDFRLIAAHLHRLINQSQADPVALLKILRFLENLHHDIRELHLQPALPVHRHELYALLREMESEGGWPYIPRMQLRDLLAGEAQAISSKTEDESQP